VLCPQRTPTLAGYKVIPGLHILRLNAALTRQNLRFSANGVCYFSLLYRKPNRRFG
jgi:hypothetical protein